MHVSTPLVADLPPSLRSYRDALAAGVVRYGHMCWFRHDDPVGLALATYGEWAQQEIDLLRAIVRPGDTVVDVGSYIGTHARGLANAVGESGRVIAVEPQPLVVDLLRLNTSRCLASVEVLHAAFGADESRLELPPPAVEEHSNFGALKLRDAGGAPGTGSSVPVLTVDGLSLDVVRLLKIDVEGMEADVLKGAAETIKVHRPYIYAEANSIDAAAPVHALLREFGYRLWLHRPPAYNAQNVAREPSNIFGVACESNILAIPLERLHELPGSPLADSQHLVRVPDLDVLAFELMRTPRFGDETPFDRDPATLQKRLKEGRAEAEAAQEQASSTIRELAERLKVEEQRGDAAREQTTVAVRERDAALSAGRQLRDELGQARAQLRAIEDSTAWKVAKPVRVLGAAKRKIAERRTGRILKLARSCLTGRLRADLQRERHRRAILASGLFDAGYYRATYPDVPAHGALDHYLQHGAAEGRRPNPFFDGEWYLESYPDVAASNLNPLLHFALTGAAEGRDPGPRFSTSWYLAVNHDIQQTDLNPLTHFLRHGREEGRSTLPPAADELDDVVEVPIPSAPSESEWALVRPPEASGSDPVVIVPVYRGYAETLRCLYSVLTSTCQVGYRLLVVDDASPEPGLADALRKLAERDLFEVITNDENLGFVKSVNRGMRAAPGRDVVLLNSDTEVYGDWLDRLRKVAEAAPRRGTVTPLTNSGTIASYPKFVSNNAGGLECTPEETDTLARASLAGETVDLPTCVGFCVYLRRDCLDAVGLFDEESFGLGYGEENDFSMRATDLGWHHVLAGEVFVWHHGSRSFGPSASARQAAGLEVLNRRYPGYHKLVSEHINADPAADMRRRLDLARLERLRAGAPSMLLVTHALGGGTERHVQDLASRLYDSGVFPLVLRPGADGTHVRLGSPLAAQTPNLLYRWEDAVDPELVAALATLAVRHVHIHHLQGYDSGPARMTRLAGHLKSKFDVTLHDFTAICPRVDMVDDTRRFCGGPAPAKCQGCIRRNGSPYGRPDVAEWRRDYADLLAAARRVITPSHDTAAHIGRVLPDVACTVLPHPEDQQPIRVVGRDAGDGITHVAVLGAVSVAKGSELLHDMACDAARRELPIRFHVFGYTNNDSMYRGIQNVTISGRYRPEDLPELVQAAGCRIAFFPAVWPETYSYTLSEALAMGLRAVSLDIGAIAERIRESGCGAVLPWELCDDPSQLNDRLLALRPAQMPGQHPVASYADLLHDYYGLDLQRRVPS